MSMLEPVGPDVETLLTNVTELTGVAASAQLRTPCGSRRAENIRVGDLIVTRDNGLQPVRMIWTSTLAKAVAVSPENAAIRIAPRAIGPMMPRTPLIVAPDQALLLPAYLLSADVAGPAGLIPARALAGRSDGVYLDRMMDDAPFYNFGFDNHEVLNVSGLCVASYRPDVKQMGAMDPGLRETLSRRYPQLREKREPFPHCRYDRVPVEAYAPGAL